MKTKKSKKSKKLSHIIGIETNEIDVLQISKLQKYIKKFDNYKYLSMKKDERNKFFQEFISLQNNFIIIYLKLLTDHFNVL
jgi:hypothetical protein